MLKQFSEVIHRRKSRFNTRLAIFSFFIVVATILWYLNKLGNEYTADLSFPLRIVNQPKGKIIVGEPPKEISLKVNAFGYFLLRYKIGSSLMPITIDLSQVILQSYNNSDSRFFLLTSRLRRSISSELSSDFQLEAIMPDTLFFEFTTLVEKKVKVLPKLSISLERQYMQSGPVIAFPDSVTISGPKSLIDTIADIFTLPIKQDRLVSTFETEGVLPTIKQVAFSHRKVKITVPIEKFTEASITIPVEVKNKPEDIDIKLIPGSVVLKCNVVLSQYSNLNSRYFTAQVDYFAIDMNMAKRIRVTISRKPDFIQKYDFEPKYIEYIIEKK